MKKRVVAAIMDLNFSRSNAGNALALFFPLDNHGCGFSKITDEGSGDPGVSEIS